MTNTLFVSLSIYEAITHVNRFVDNSFTGQKVDHYEIKDNEHRIVVLSYERYSYWANNYVSLNVIIDDCYNKTRIHYSTSGGGSGLLNLKWGSEKRLFNGLTRVLEEYQINPNRNFYNSENNG